MNQYFQSTLPTQPDTVGPIATCIYEATQYLKLKVPAQS